MRAIIDRCVDWVSVTGTSRIWKIKLVVAYKCLKFKIKNEWVKNISVSLYYL